MKHTLLGLLATLITGCVAPHSETVIFTDPDFARDTMEAMQQAKRAEQANLD